MNNEVIMVMRTRITHLLFFHLGVLRDEHCERRIDAPFFQVLLEEFLNGDIQVVELGNNKGLNKLRYRSRV